MECLVRQDRHADALPLMGPGPFAELYAHLDGPAWQVSGTRHTRVPFLATDPLPAVQASLNGGPPLPDGSPPAGVLGTTVFYHLLTTMDYARRALVLRRKGFRPDGERLPLWLAGDHFPCTLGSLRHYGPRVVTVDTGGIGHGLDTTVEMAQRAGIAVDYDHPQDGGGTRLYPIRPDRLSLGHAVGRDIPGFASDGPGIGIPGPSQAAMFGFTPITNFTHEFFKPYAVTFDYARMNLHISR